MSRPDLDDKLTPAARQALDELLTDYRDQLLLGARESASRLGELREISVHDIVTGFERARLRWRSPLAHLADRLSRWYTWFGIMIAAGALIYLVGREAARGQAPEQKIPLVVALAGLCLSALGYFGGRFLRKRQLLRRLAYPFELPPAPSEYVGRYLAAWRDLELALRGTAASQLGESAANAPISMLLQVLDDRRMLDDFEGRRLRELLLLRNVTVHGRGDVRPEQLEEASRDAERILKKLGTHAT